MYKLPHSLSAATHTFSEQQTLTISTLVTSLHGSTQPKLVLCNDGRPYVLKMHENPSGPNALANEFISATLLQGLGLPTPRCGLIIIDQETLDSHPNLTLKTTGKHHRPNVGIHFGSEFVECFLRDGGRRNLIHSPEFLGIGIFDIWAAQSDTRQFVNWWNPKVRREVKLYIDNASLFGGPDWDRARLIDLSMRNGGVKFIEETKYQRRITSWINQFQRRIPRLLQEALARLPAEWYKGDIQELQQLLLERLAYLPHIVSHAMLPDTHRRKLTFEAQDCSYRVSADN